MRIKERLLNFIKTASTAEPIHDISDYHRVKKWMKKTLRLYIVFSIAAILLTALLFVLFRYLQGTPDILYLLLPPIFLLNGWGYATLTLYLPQVIKTITKAGSIGYQAGEQIETTHVQITHEYGNTYRASSYTTNEGCLFAFIGASLSFLVWMVFCVYIGPFLTFKKWKDSRDNLQAYSEK